MASSPPSRHFSTFGVKVYSNNVSFPGLTIASPGSGHATAPTVNFSAPKNGIASSCTGPTTVSEGTLALSGSHASMIALSSPSVLEIALDELGLTLFRPTRASTRPIRTK
jgi:hypothetical protein